MWSQAGLDVGASRLGAGSCTMMSPLDVTAHRACSEGLPTMPLLWQQDSPRRDSYKRGT